jgi:hypothetical protein
MSTGTNTFVASNTLPKIRVAVRDSKTGSKLALAGIYTATITWSVDSAASVSRAMSVLTGVNDGYVEYQFAAGELIAGTMQIQVTITEIATGFTATTTNEIKKIIGASL